MKQKNDVPVVLQPFGCTDQGFELVGAPQVARVADDEPVL
jgi:hypothetical protein